MEITRKGPCQKSMTEYFLTKLIDSMCSAKSIIEIDKKEWKTTSLCLFVKFEYISQLSLVFCCYFEQVNVCWAFNMQIDFLVGEISCKKWTPVVGNLVADFVQFICPILSALSITLIFTHFMSLGSLCTPW